MISYRSTVAKVIWKRKINTVSTCIGSLLKKAEYPQFLEDSHFKVDSLTTSLLRSLATSKLIKISSSLHTLKLDVDLPQCSFAPKNLFIRDCYNDLYNILYKHRQSVLIGNPGISKSVFQFYFIARVVNPWLNEGSHKPVDYWGKTVPPKIIIRQIGSESMQVWDTEDLIVYRTKDVNSDILSAFDVKSSIYLFEPGLTLDKEPLMDDNRIFRTIATVSPDIRRYKEFSKGHTLMYYMPVWSLDDILNCYHYISLNNEIPPAAAHLYSESLIRSCFDEWGGIFRHIFVDSAEQVEKLRSQRLQAIGKFNADSFLATGNIEDAGVSHLLAFYDVKSKGKNAYRISGVRFDFVSDSVKKSVIKKILQISLTDRITLLLRNDETGFMDIASRDTYELVISDLMCSNQIMCWSRKLAGTTSWTPLKIKPFSHVEVGKPPVFSEMISGVLYKPLNEKYPGVDLMFKDDNGCLVGINVTRERKKKEIFVTAINTWKKSVIGLSDCVVTKLIVIPSPIIADKLKVTIQNKRNNYRTSVDKSGSEMYFDQKDQDSYAANLEIWKLPLKYLG